MIAEDVLFIIGLIGGIINVGFGIYEKKWDAVKGWACAIIMTLAWWSK